MDADLALSFAMTGDLEAACARYKKAYLTAVKEGGTAEALDLQGRLRAEVLEARLGQGVANAWRLETYPPGVRLSYDPAWLLHSNAAAIVEAFSRGGRIEPRKGQGLAVPIPGSPAYDIKVKRGSTRVAEVVRRFGPLTSVHTAKGTLMLVATLRGNKKGELRALSVRTNKAGQRFSPTNQARVSVPMFWVVRSVRLEQRLHWPAIAKRAEGSFAARVEARLRDRFADAAASATVEGSVPAGFD